MVCLRKEAQNKTFNNVSRLFHVLCRLLDARYLSHHRGEIWRILSVTK